MSTVPPGAVESTAAEPTAGDAVESKARVVPRPPEISAIRVETSSPDASMTWVAPNSRARSSRAGTRSIAMRIAGFSRAAPQTADRPTAPAP